LPAFLRKQLTLVVPGLLDLAETDPARTDADGAALARLLATSPPPAEHDGAIGIACAALGIAKQRDWPVAPLLAIAANLDPGDAYWLLAEPVSLLVGQLDVQLDAVVDDLSVDEAAALLATLNSHFAGDGLRFVAVTPARWLIAAASVQRLVTHPANDAIGAPIFRFLPDGPDAARWRRWQSEMQMLLFAHPVASERERHTLNRCTPIRRCRAISRAPAAWRSHPPRNLSRRGWEPDPNRRRWFGCQRSARAIRSQRSLRWAATGPGR
jgi:hypothetical protein